MSNIRETRIFCDCCNKELAGNTYTYGLGAVLPFTLDAKAMGYDTDLLPLGVGSSNHGGEWEAELCKDCFAAVMEKVYDLRIKGGKA